MIKFFKFVLFFTIVLFASESFAVQKSKPISTDNRIRTYLYSPNEVFIFVGHYRFQSAIEFEKDEKILTVSLGDTMAWKISTSGNRIFLKPSEKDATTNMTVVSDKRTYFFELYAEDAKDIRDEDMMFVARFIYGGYASESNENVKTFTPPPTPEQANESFKPDLSKPENYNFNYTLSGVEKNAPIKVFDDGEFTYFQFRDKNSELPAFFEIDGEGKEAIVNYRVVGDYVVVEKVTSQYTLRSGSDVICVFNEARPLEKKFKPQPESLAPKRRKM